MDFLETSVSAYLLGAFVSEILPSPVKKLGFLRWDTYLIIFETAVLLLLRRASG